MEDITENLNSLDNEIKDTVDSINDIVNDVSLYGFNTIDEREIVYGVSTAIGIDPLTDTVIELGSNVGELYFYIQRLLGKHPVGYYGIESNEKFIDISRFRINEDNTEFFNLDLNTIIEFLKQTDNTGLSNMMDIVSDWGVLINQFNNIDSAEIANIIEILIRIPSKGIVITNRFTEDELKILMDGLLKSEMLKNRFIMRSDFIPGWYSFYFYNNR